MCFFKVKHTIGHISRMVGSIDVKRKGGASVRSWVNYVTLTFVPTHDLDLVVSRSKFEIALWGGGLVAMEWKGCESIVHDHDRDLWVSMVGWVDVPCIDWGDFRRRRAVDISSFPRLPLSRRHHKNQSFWKFPLEFRASFDIHRHRNNRVLCQNDNEYSMKNAWEP